MRGIHNFVKIMNFNCILAYLELFQSIFSLVQSGFPLVFKNGDVSLE